MDSESMSTPIDVEKLRARDQEALETLFLKLAPVMRNSVRRFWPAPQSSIDADDIIAEVFLQLVRDPDRLADLAGAGKLESYCYALARNKAVHILRRKRKDAESAFQYESELDRLETQTPDPIIDKEALERALASLGEIPRQVVLMRILEGYSLNAIAATLGIAERVVWSMYSRTLKQLRQALASLKEEPGR